MMTTPQQELDLLARSPGKLKTPISKTKITVKDLLTAKQLKGTFQCPHNPKSFPSHSTMRRDISEGSSIHSQPCIPCATVQMTFLNTPIHSHNP